MASRAEEVAVESLAWFYWIKAIACIWFVRVSWLLCLAWGLFDWYLVGNGGISGLDYAPTEDDVAIRSFTGAALFFVWLFIVRTRGPFTLNRNKYWETFPTNPLPPIPPRPDPYARKSDPYHR